MRSHVHWAAALGLAASMSVGAVSPVAAQSTGTLRGRVVDATNQRPLAGAQVAVSGTMIVGSTGQNGDYTLINVPSGDRTVSVRRIGYMPGSQTATIPVGGEARLDFALGVSA